MEVPRDKRLVNLAGGISTLLVNVRRRRGGGAGTPADGRQQQRDAPPEVVAPAVLVYSSSSRRQHADPLRSMYVVCRTNGFRERMARAGGGS